MQKDLSIRVIEVIDAWDRMRSHKSFFGLTVDGLRQKAKAYLDARDEIVELEKQTAHAFSRRDQAAPELLLVLQGVVAAVRGDPEETQNGEFYAAMGYVHGKIPSRKRRDPSTQSGGTHMSALVTGIAAFFVAALGALCPHHFVYVPALLAVIVAGGYVGGTVFSLQSEGVYDLRIRGSRAVASAGDVRLGGIWAYGLVGIPAGAIALLIAGRMVGVDDSAVAEVLSSTAGVAGSVRRMAMCLGMFAVSVVGGFLGLNLIRVVSDRMKAEIQRQLSGEVEPLRLLEKGKMLMEEQSYAESLDAFRALGRQDSSLAADCVAGPGVETAGPAVRSH